MTLSALNKNMDAALIELGKKLKSDQIITDSDVLESYAIDTSEAEPHQPDAVLRARSAQDIAETLRIANHYRIPVTPRAAGTGRTGGAVPLAGGIVLSVEHMQKIKEIDRDNFICVAEPGVITGELQRSVENEALFYPPDPNSLDSCMLGGNIAENAGGPRAFKYGVTRDYVLGMQVVTAAGEILSLGKRTLKGVTGYDLTALLVGSEGTLGVITEATFKLLALPEKIVTLAVFFKDNSSALDSVTAMGRAGIISRCYEFLDQETLDVLRPKAALDIPKSAQAMIIMELDGSEQQVDRDLEKSAAVLETCGAIEVLVAKNNQERSRLWGARREMSHALRERAAFKLAEDVVVPRDKLRDLVDYGRELSERFKIRTASYGHAGDGNLHMNFLWDDPAERPTVEKAIKALFEKVVALRGTLTGEHGVGILKAPYLGLEQSETLIDYQKRIKKLFDPNGILNPGKIFPSEAKAFGHSHLLC
ncbi:MAG: FAD-binding protein [Myxococcales bacterium]|nr:MAG: FAD-binding protein [Myxococcales bacterium]